MEHFTALVHGSMAVPLFPHDPMVSQHAGCRISRWRIGGKGDHQEDMDNDDGICGSLRWPE